MFARTHRRLAITRGPGAVRIWFARATAVLVLLAAVPVLHAQEAPGSDPPERVARVSDTEGTVSLQPAGMQAWSAAQLNRPLTTGDRLWCDQDSRAELDLGIAAVRLGSRTAFAFFNLDDHVVQIQLTAGTLIVHVREVSANQVYEVDTPNLAVTLLEPGEYRIEVSDSGEATVVRVSEGRAQAEGGSQSVTIGMQQMARFGGTQALTYETEPFGVPDDFDAWSAARERGLMNSPSGDYVPPDMPGTQDLDGNGTWELTPDYGYVWAPMVVVAAWAPYRFGHWAFIPPWGWTWIDDAAWGFAPYHYGRWVQWNSAWCWVPGPRRVHPVYAPAMVGWVGGPGRQGGALGANVGWFPLGPHEVYVPPYAVSPRYARAVNLTNTVVTSGYVGYAYQNGVTDLRYRNNTPAAVTVVPQGVFASGEHVRGRAVALTAAVLAGTAVTARAPAIMPQRPAPPAALAQSVAHPPPAYLNRPVLARTPPPRAPVAFDRELAAMQANGGGALARPALAQLQPDMAAAPVRVLAGGNRALQQVPAPAPASVGGGAMPSLAERERALETSTLGGAPRDYRERALPQPPILAPAASASAATPSRGERPPPGVSPAPAAAGSPGATARPGVSVPANEGYRVSAPAPRAAAPPAPSYHAPSTVHPPETHPPAAAPTPAHASTSSASGAHGEPGH